MPKKHESVEPAVAYTIREAAEQARCSVGTFYNLWQRGEGPRRTKIGPWKVVILREELETWLRSRTEQSA